MNKKLLYLLVPIIVMSMMSFGYAHFTDDVVKKYKIHVGSVYLDIVGFHVDYAKMPDVNNDGIIFGDELIIDIYEDPDLCTWFEEITADPITGGFELVTTTWLHNGGKLPFELDWGNVFQAWDGPYDEDPCFDTPPGQPIGSLPSPPWHFDIEVYRWHYYPDRGEYVREGPFAPTQVHYKPCDYIEVIQKISFDQPLAGEDYQKEWQCTWIKLWVTFHAQDVWDEYSSFTVDNLPEIPEMPPPV